MENECRAVDRSKYKNNAIERSSANDELTNPVSSNNRHLDIAAHTCRLWFCNEDFALRNSRIGRSRDQTVYFGTWHFNAFSYAHFFPVIYVAILTGK